MLSRFLRRRDPTARLSVELKAYALAMTRDPDIAEDLVQETLARMLERPGLLEDSTMSKRYAFRTLHNLYIDNLRKNKVRQEYSAVQERLSSEADGAGFDAVDRLIVRNAFELLTPEHREILFLIDVMGFKYAEAAETLGVAKGTVMSRVSRARAEMVRKLQESPVRPLKRRGKNGN
ncbi:sigma-70 family RNA polymerase sigma factor [Hoeflea poritis]|uniref:Sigma-70 family RNA polymerase sigma factor n=1 Tax=Hoeflea poritis TaxID=2993659 RepID=A0ABT4VN77_9HYPH|nr:sigma-70 family RNA polymerase sigma factor [Hoeflea poritis]MDA4846134.1 sigma-70 family RNA polymerase sigma factor [Hoeflea poritis]